MKTGRILLTLTVAAVGIGAVVYMLRRSKENATAKTSGRPHMEGPPISTGPRPGEGQGKTGQAKIASAKSSTGLVDKLEYALIGEEFDVGDIGDAVEGLGKVAMFLL